MFDFSEKPYILHNGDCLEVMRTFADNSVDCVITDPPYGIAINRSSKLVGTSVKNSRVASSLAWDDFIPSKEYFDEIKRISRNQIIFGANYFWSNFYESQCYIIWDKRGNLPEVPFCDTEFAWTSFVTRPSKRYVVINHGFIRDSNEARTGHPTQKPILLMQKILQDFTKEGDIILDSFLGSGTTGVACAIEKRKFIGIELDKNYFDIATARIKRANLEPCDIPQNPSRNKDLPLFENNLA